MIVPCSRRKINRGFLLVELMCVIAVFVIVIHAAFILQMVSITIVTKSLKQKKEIAAGALMLERFRAACMHKVQSGDMEIQQNNIPIRLQWRNNSSRCIESVQLQHSCRVVKEKKSSTILLVG